MHKVDRSGADSPSYEEYFDIRFDKSDSDLKSIPSVADSKEHTCKDDRSKKVEETSLNEDTRARKLFNENDFIEGQWQNNHLIELDSCEFGHPEHFDIRLDKSDSDLKSIPSVADSKEHTCKDDRSKIADQSSFNENTRARKLFNESDYIEGQWKNNHLIELDSCQFSHPDNNYTVYIRKQSSGYLFTFDEENFIARVNFNKIEELRIKELNIAVVRNVLKDLKITKIIEDELLNDRDKAYEQFKQLLQNRSKKTADNLEYAEDIFQFSKRLEVWKRSPHNIWILDDIVKNKHISNEIKSSAQHLLDNEKALIVRKKKFAEVAQFHTMDLLTRLQKICQDGIYNHSSTLYDKYFRSISLMPDYLSRLNDKSIFYISKKDIELFVDLIGMMNKQPFLDFIGNSWDNLFDNFAKIRQHNTVNNFAPLTNPIYFYLCKSLKELILEISIEAEVPINDLLRKNEQGEWGLIKTINWPSTSALNRSLEQQYRFIFRLVKHFEPGCYSKTKKFKIDKTFLQSIKSLFGSSEKYSNIPQERLVWMYTFDNAITNLFSKQELQSLKPLIQCYEDFIENTEDEHYEQFRIVTHNVIRFIAQTSPYLSKGTSDAILTKQIKSIEEVFLNRQSDDFRDLVDVCNEYWKNKKFIWENISDKFPYAKFREDMNKICQALLDITSIALDKKAKPQGFIKYFRSFNEFLDDLNGIDFSWFIKEDDINDNFTAVELVNAEKNSYKVVNPESFIKYRQKIPNHYVIEIIQDLLSRVSNLLRQNKWSDDDNLSATSELLSAMKKSFLYLKEQPNYVSFNTFKEESTKPFISVVNNSSSYEDFKKRIDIIGKSFWYLRKQDEIDIDKALELYREENFNNTTEILRNCYRRYLEKFEFYIQETSDKIDQDKIEFIIEKVKKQFEQIKFNEWDSKFKREILSELLAGLAAVWSIQESKDIASTGKSLKPHCIQILCILRLLSVDKDSKGVDKHLAQVLTGQGKSLVLGLLAALLALTGHRVRTVCYSEYLVTRDQQDFNYFFKQFGIRDKIVYVTFEEMANEVLKPKINGKRQGLRELVKDRILNHSAEQVAQISQEDISNTILLIDEVDVFFSDQFYGNSYNASNIIRIPGLANIHEKIWEMAASKKYENNIISEEIEKFINQEIREGNEEFREFNKFRFEPSEYHLLNDKNNQIATQKYTNRSLYEEHLDKMIKNAINVAKGSDNHWFINRYKINDEGLISFRRSDGVYSINSCPEYYNVFNYFRLKGKDFNRTNYGYLIVSCGRVSYARLPEKYPLILGVTGTLTTLHDHEKKAVTESYNIRENSVMPSFFGDSHLKFDENKHFITQDYAEEWLSKIFSHANSKVSLGQSVLIFFDTDVEISKFKEKFVSKIDRLHVLTENTEEHAKEKYIDEAGIAKTITLATRGMGRGVDFKSSVAVEKSGGVHVIQTFFSLDIKEETQIKGRTARKDNKGSYELILCKEDLIKAGFLKRGEVAVDYQTLNENRKLKIEEKGSNDEERIKESERDHKTTMDFLESFFF